MRNSEIITSLRSTLISLYHMPNTLEQRFDIVRKIRCMEAQEFSEIDEQGIRSKIFDLVQGTKEEAIFPAFDMLIQTQLEKNASATDFLDVILLYLGMFGINVDAVDLLDDGLVTRNSNFVDDTL